jgi:hypothetical protein
MVSSTLICHGQQLINTLFSSGTHKPAIVQRDWSMPWMLANSSTSPQVTLIRLLVNAEIGEDSKEYVKHLKKICD